MPSSHSTKAKASTNSSGQTPIKQTMRRLAEHQKNGSTSMAQSSNVGKTSAGEASQYNAASSTLSFTPTAPAPDLQQRALIFDSLFTVNDLSYMSNNSSGNKQPTIQRRTSLSMGGGDQLGSTFVYTFGAGHYSQLGRKVTMKLQSPTAADRGSIASRGSTSNSVPTVLSSLPGITIKAVACGHNHTALVSDSGQLYTFGDDRKNQLGHAVDNQNKHIPLPVLDGLQGVRIVSVACGAAHTVALSDNGNVYTFGSSKFGQCGHGDRQTQKIAKRIDHILVKGEVVQIACGEYHTLCMTRSGAVVAFGCGTQGQTGLGDEDDRLEPEKIMTLGEPVLSIACGTAFSVFITQSNQIYVSGFGEYFKPNTIDNSSAQHFYYKPTYIPTPEPMQSVACGHSHIVGVSVTGNCWSWGAGDAGQLGHGVIAHSAVPKCVLDSGDIVYVAAGRYHSLAVTHSGVLYGWGSNSEGSLGMTSSQSLTATNSALTNGSPTILIPTIIAPLLSTVVGTLAAGEYHTVVLTAAPWSTLPTDVCQWYQQQQLLYEMKVKEVQRQNRGLGLKDLQRIRHEWQAICAKQVQEQQMWTEAEQREQIKEITALLESACVRPIPGSNGALGAPAINQPLDTGNDDENQHQNGQYTKLPQIVSPRNQQQKPTFNTSKPSAMRKYASTSQSHAPRQSHQSDASTLSQTFSHLNNALNSDSSLASTIPLPFTRTQFLKDTTQILKNITGTVRQHSDVQQTKEVESLHHQLRAVQRDYNTIHALAKQKHHHLKELQSQLLVIQNQLQHPTSPSNSQTHYNHLKMQLNTISIKIDETLENRQNYELNVQLLKDADLNSAHSLTTLRQQENHLHQLTKKLQDERAQAVATRATSEQEVANFREEIRSYLKFLQHQLQQFEEVVKIHTEKQQKRQAELQRKNAQNESVKQLKIDALETEVQAVQQQTTELEQQLHTIDLRAGHFAYQFHQLYVVTGLTDPEEMISRWKFKQEISDQLKGDCNVKQQKIDALKVTLAELQQKLHYHQSQHQPVTWKHIEQQHEAVREVQIAAEREHSVAEQAMSNVLTVQEGLWSLHKHLQQTDIDSSDDASQKADRMIVDPANGVWKHDHLQMILQQMQTHMARLGILHQQHQAELHEQYKRDSMAQVLNVMRSPPKERKVSVLQELETTLNRYEDIEDSFKQSAETQHHLSKDAPEEKSM